ncbi:metallophosphoesterase family protein [Commensalibacter oyaizuii]|uniref:Metallophosphoesterase n=1 Tax=Commensalibacter oyaizuii TaxID=3043873 RepID=A0ABT6Q1N0_9PROT|nr:metallophosphoesterase [Commensalibacter sp. TBRC 16381]MDI2091005.1 metallophosphoesterase [Commensalibacter sp. TBRC 16381]
MKRFTIAHISDIHLPLESIQFSKLSLCNKRFLSFLSWKKRRLILQKKMLDQIINDIANHKPDLVVITGDLTNLALPEEFQQAAEWLNNLPFSKIRVIPGNHDALVSTKWYNSYAYWTPWTKAYSNQDYPIVTKTDMTALIGINSAVPTLPLFASGHIDKNQLQRLRSILYQTKKEGLFRIVVLHHPPVSGIVTKRKALRNRKKLQQILLEEGAEMILYGHVHKTMTQKFLNTDIPLLGIASASSNSTRPQRQAAWRKITLERVDNQLNVKSTVRALDKNQQFFEKHSFYLNH